MGQASGSGEEGPDAKPAALGRAWPAPQDPGPSPCTELGRVRGVTKDISGKKDSPVELLSAYGRGNFKDNTLCVPGCQHLCGHGHFCSSYYVPHAL